MGLRQETRTMANHRSENIKCLELNAPTDNKAGGNNFVRK